MMKPKVIDPEQQRLLADYAHAAHHFAETVDHLQEQASNVEGFIEALEATGTAHRACERARIQLTKHLTARMQRTQ
jgi:hypothetical protein